MGNVPAGVDRLVFHRCYRPHRCVLLRLKLSFDDGALNRVLLLAVLGFEHGALNRVLLLAVFGFHDGTIRGELFLALCCLGDKACSGNRFITVRGFHDRFPDGEPFFTVASFHNRSGDGVLTLFGARPKNRSVASDLLRNVFCFIRDAKSLNGLGLHYGFALQPVCPVGSNKNLVPPSARCKPQPMPLPA